MDFSGYLGYWAPGRTGYSTDLVPARRYSRAEAIDICHNALPGHWAAGPAVPGLPVREDDLVAMLEGM